MSHSRNSSKSSSSRRSSASGSSQESKSNSEIILDLGATTDIAEAQDNVKEWIQNQFKKIQGTWKPLWGMKLTEGKRTEAGGNEYMRNLGKVIGKEYCVTGMRYTDGSKTLASFRVDWDAKKGMHFNPEIQDITSRKRFAYKFGNISDDSKLDSESQKTVGELAIINQMLSLTKDALDKNELMNPQQAQLILSNFQIQTQINRSYFKEFAELLRPLVNAAYTVIQNSIEHNNEDAYKFDFEILSTQVSSDLQDIWTPEVELYLDHILHNPNTTLSETLNPIATQVLISELVYFGDNTNNLTLAGRLTNFFVTKDIDIVKTFLTQIKDTISDARSLEKLQVAIEAINNNLMELSHPIKTASETNLRPKSSSADIFKSLMNSPSEAKNALEKSLESQASVSLTKNYELRTEAKAKNVADKEETNELPNPHQRPRVG